MAISTGTLSTLLQQLYKDYRGTEAERKKRYGAGLGELTEMARLFGPGYGAGMEREALAGAKSALIGRGLGGTTRPMAVSAGMKARFEDLRRGRLAGALSQMADYRRTFPEGTATAGTLAHLATGGFSGMLEANKLALQAAEQSGLGPMARQGLDIFGKPLSGSLAETQATYMKQQMGGGGSVGTIGTPDFSMPLSGAVRTADTTTTAPAGSPADLWAKGQWTGYTPIEDLTSGVSYEWADGGVPSYQDVGMTGMLGSLPGQSERYEVNYGGVKEIIEAPAGTPGGQVGPRYARPGYTGIRKI